MNDPHGYIYGFRRLIWFAIFAALVVVLILTHSRSAQ